MTTTTSLASSTTQAPILIQTSPTTSATSSVEDFTSTVIENRTVTRSALLGSSTSAAPSAVAGASKSFLENKVASGVVFGICGLAGLALILLIVWFALRKTRRLKKLEKEIISFDPDDVGHYHRPGDLETASKHTNEKARSNSSLDHYAGTGYAPTMNAADNDYGRNAAPYTGYTPAPHMAIQRPGNAAFNPVGGSVDLSYSRSVRNNQYQYNRAY